MTSDNIVQITELAKVRNALTSTIRFIAEAEQAGAFTTEVLVTMSKEMDKPVPELLDYLEKIGNFWDEIKKSI